MFERLLTDCSERSDGLGPLPSQPRAQLLASSSDAHEMPCAEGLLAASLALSAAVAQSRACCQQADIVRRITEYLLLLSQQPQLSEGFKASLFQVRASWLAWQHSAHTQVLGRQGHGAATPSIH